MSTSIRGTDPTSHSVLSCRVPARPRLRELRVLIEFDDVVLACILEGSDGRRLRVDARRGIFTDMEWTGIWVDQLPVEDVAASLATHFETSTEGMTGIVQLIERTIDLAAMTSEARGRAGVAVVQREVQAALNTIYEGAQR